MIQKNNTKDVSICLSFIKKYISIDNYKITKININTKLDYYIICVIFSDKKKTEQLFSEFIIDKNNYKILHYFSNKAQIKEEIENEENYTYENVIKIFNYEDKWISIPENKNINLYEIFNKEKYYTYVINNHKLKLICKGEGIHQNFNKTIRKVFLDKEKYIIYFEGIHINLWKKDFFKSDESNFVRLPKNFDIKIAENDYEFNEWLSGVNEKILGIKVGWETDKKDLVNKLSYLQFSTSKSCIIYKINNVLPETVINILIDKSIYKYGIGILNDIKKLNMIADIKVENWLDLSEMAKKLGFKAPGLGINGNIHGKKSLCEILLNKKYIESKKTISNFNIKNLSESRKKYMALSVWICIEILNKLSNLNVDI
jgi:hypothetical protein